MSYNLQFKKESFAGEIPFLDSAHVRWIRGGITIDRTKVTEVEGKRKLKAGAFVGKVAGGKYAPYVPAVAASKVIGDSEDDNAVLFRAKLAGVGGNGIKVQLIDPSGNNQPLSVLVEADTIKVSLATGEAGAITSKAKDVAAAVNIHQIAKALVSADATINDDEEGNGVVSATEGAVALAGGANANIDNVVLLGTDVDVTEHDAVATALDHARVIVARLPQAPDEYIKGLLPGVVWK